jgi:hypothetical protein
LTFSLAGSAMPVTSVAAQTEPAEPTDPAGTNEPNNLYIPMVTMRIPMMGLGVSGENSTTLPNGAALTVSIDDPVTSTEFLIPPGSSSLDIDVMGSASIGMGEPDASFIYVIDVSGSTDQGSGTGCAPVLDCEQQFVTQLNDAVIAGGSADEVGLVVFASDAATADMSPVGGDQLITQPDAGPGDVDTVINSTFSVFGGDGGVMQFTPKTVGVFTNCTAALQRALDVVSASSNATNIVVFVSDGQCDNSGGGGLTAFDNAIADLSTAGAVVNSIAAGTASSCTVSVPGFDGPLEDIAQGTGGMCFEVPDPGDLPDIIPNLIGATLESLEIEVDGGGMTPIANTDIDPDLPQAAAATVTYNTSVTGLGPGDHEICVTANGSDVTGGTASVTQCETIHVYALSLVPPEEVNELSSEDTHAVTFTLQGDHDLGGRLVTFTVGGQNAGATGTCSPNSDCTTDASGQVTFEYSVPVEPDSLGMDTISASITLNDPLGETGSLEVTKQWVDTTPPEADCVGTVNPHGENVPPPENEDGFFELLAEDTVDPAPQVFLVDTGVDNAFGTADDWLYGPFLSGVKVKYVEANGITPPAIEPGPGVIDWMILGQGDAATYGVDASGNESDPVACRVPPPPK